jgi:hypothetical protein
MYNPATRPQNELNDFTRFFAHMPAGWPGRTAEYWIKLRNGALVRPFVFLGEDDWEDDYNKPRGFRDENWNYCWNLDGTSVTRRDYDMMELVVL